MKIEQFGQKDWVLIVWILSSTAWDFAVFGTAGYLIFYKGISAWWFVFAWLLCSSTTLFKVLRKRYGIEEIKLEKEIESL